EINAGIQQHLQKAYNTNKAAFKAQHWVIDHTIGTYNVEKIRRARPKNITASEWDKGRPQPLRSTRRSLTSSAWHTLLMGNSFEMMTDEEMSRLEATGTYTDDEINRLARGGKQRGHIPSMGRVLPARATASPSTPAHESTLNSLHKKVDFMMSLFKSNSKYSDIFHSLSRVVPAIVAGAGTRRVPTIRTTRIRMAMAILSCVIYGDCRWGRNPLRAFSSDYSPATSRQGNPSTVTSRRESRDLSLGKRLNVVVNI
nr:F-box domain, leucine-rich repeat domain, L domain-like protein [Tanacetum cinerariifolium]